jgi:hypothetical protein
VRLLVVIAAALTLAAITAPLPTAAAAPNVVAEPAALEP